MFVQKIKTLMLFIPEATKPNSLNVTDSPRDRSLDQMPGTKSARKARAMSSASGKHQALPPAKHSWLLRLFESKLFDMSLAVTYLFNSKEQGVQTYIGKYKYNCTHFSFH